MVIWNELTTLWRELNRERGYQEVRTPILYNVEVWKRSGHWEAYRDNMYFTEVEAGEFGIKPMNCPGDAHIFCTHEQIEDEVIGCLELAQAIYGIFQLDLRIELSTRPEKRIGADELWDAAETSLHAALARAGVEYQLNEGDGAFYGPKIDLHMTDSIGRSWQMCTIQLDFQMPERFGITYTGEDNAEHTPAMIHRALFGSFERFIGILIEHYAGAFPVWLAPVQALVIPVADRHNDYARQVVAELNAAGLRAEADTRGESVGKKIAQAERQKMPRILVVGDREVESGQVSVRRRGEGDAGAQPLADLRGELLALSAERAPS